MANEIDRPHTPMDQRQKNSQKVNFWLLCKKQTAQTGTMVTLQAASPEHLSNNEYLDSYNKVFQAGHNIQIGVPICLFDVFTYVVKMLGTAEGLKFLYTLVPQSERDRLLSKTPGAWQGYGLGQN